ncbi:hypothetical protein ASG90_01370 [Nocardioides sp. Soil797]|nr:hypothetical protein ASG90_01370 [Nocardioides sp. Soil797]
MGDVAASIGHLRATRLRARDEHAFSNSAHWEALDQLESWARAAPGRGVPEGAFAARAFAELVEVIDERRATRAQDDCTRRETDARLASAIDRLSRISSSGEMSRRAPAELRDACGFTRVMISSARGSRWLPDTMRREDHADPDAAEFDQFAHDGNEIPLARSMLETEMVRHRVAVIVEDAETDPRTYKPLVRVTQSRSYVAAPLTTNRRVIGFLHADRLGQHSPVSQGDLESVDRFAAEFSVRFECAVLRERIAGQRAGMDEVLRDITRTLADLETEQLMLPTDSATRPAQATESIQVDDPPAPLSRREEEVLTLLAAGASNRAIAQELVLSPETVKSHVASILHKLRAASRSEAVARHLQSRASTPRRGSR